MDAAQPAMLKKKKKAPVRAFAAKLPKDEPGMTDASVPAQRKPMLQLKPKALVADAAGGAKAQALAGLIRKAQGDKANGQAYLKVHGIKIYHSQPPPPCVSLARAPFPKPVLKLLQDAYAEPTPVQATTWPLAVAGHDVIAIARTGSGKTLAYLLPALLRCQAAKPTAAGKPMCLVMVPTRELALQVHTEALKYSAPLGLRVAIAYGGAPRAEQAAVLRAGCELIVATPGRLMDLLQLHPDSIRAEAASSLSGAALLVLDEADMMLNMCGRAAAVMTREMRLIAAVMTREMRLMAGGDAGGSGGWGGWWWWWWWWWWRCCW